MKPYSEFMKPLLHGGGTSPIDLTSPLSSSANVEITFHNWSNMWSKKQVMYRTPTSTQLDPLRYNSLPIKQQEITSVTSTQQLTTRVHSHFEAIPSCHHLLNDHPNQKYPKLARPDVFRVDALGGFNLSGSLEPSRRACSALLKASPHL